MHEVDYLPGGLSHEVKGVGDPINQLGNRPNCINDGPAVTDFSEGLKEGLESPDGLIFHLRERLSKRHVFTHPSKPFLGLCFHVEDSLDHHTGANEALSTHFLEGVGRPINCLRVFLNGLGRHGCALTDAAQLVAL